MRRQHTRNHGRGRAGRAVAALAVLTLAVAAPAGAALVADPDFGSTGVVLTDVAGGEDGAEAIAAAPGGTVVAAGFGELGDPERPHEAGFAFVRHLGGGATDPTFSGDGRALADFGFVNQGAEAIEVDGSGRIVAAGTITTFDGTTSSIGIARLLPSGAPDPAFGGDGLVVVDPGTLSVVGDMALDGEGRPVILGSASSSRGFRPLVVRLRGDGSLDRSFGGGGITRFGKPFADIYRSLAIDRRDRVLLGGQAPRRAGAPAPAVRRLTVRGELDGDYGGGGIARPFGGGAEIADIALDGSRLSVAATCSCAGGRGEDLAASRLTPRGRTDRGFAGDGTSVIAFGAGDAEATSVAVDPEGRVVIGGSVRIGERARWALARFGATGRPDSSFGAGGRISVDLGAGIDGVRDVAVDPASRIYAVGLGGGPGGSDFAVARFR